MGKNVEGYSGKAWEMMGNTWQKEERKWGLLLLFVGHETKTSRWHNNRVVQTIDSSKQIVK